MGVEIDDAAGPRTEFGEPAIQVVPDQIMFHLLEIGILLPILRVGVHAGRRGHWGSLLMNTGVNLSSFVLDHGKQGCSLLQGSRLLRADQQVTFESVGELVVGSAVNLTAGFPSAHTSP